MKAPYISQDEACQLWAASERALKKLTELGIEQTDDIKPLFDFMNKYLPNPKVNKEFYFMFAEYTEYLPIVVILEKAHWDKHGYCQEDPDGFMLPDGWSECMDGAYERDLKDVKHASDWFSDAYCEGLSLYGWLNFKAFARKELTSIGFVETFWDEHPKNKKENL